MCIRDSPYLRPLAECLAEFRPLVKVVNADLLKRKNPAPVSYTHLDVYKRQPCDSSKDLTQMVTLVAQARPADKKTETDGRNGENDSSTDSNQSKSRRHKKDSTSKKERKSRSHK